MQMQDSSIESSSQNFYGGLYTRYNALVGVEPASKTNSQKDWFVYDGISGGKVVLKLNKQYSNNKNPPGVYQTPGKIP